MTNREMKELGKLNAVVNSIDRVIDFVAHGFLYETTGRELMALRRQIDKRRQELVAKGKR